MRLIKAFALATALCAVGAANAGLNRVGPANVPSPAGHGFPNWYQDNNGLVLDICLPDAVDPGGAQELACILPLPKPAGGYVFPTAFPDELFYFSGVAQFDTGGGKRATMVLRLEGAFGGGVPAVNDQMVFARIRLMAGVPFAGTYTLTHPYGTASYIVDAVSPGRDIFDTVDVGLVPGDFKQALGGGIGPFLQHVDGAQSVDPANAPVQARYLINGASFLGDGNSLGPITGSPFGTNYFEMCGPFDGPALGDRCIRTDDFGLTGRVHNGAIPSPLAIDRATFNRQPDGTVRADVSVTASAGIGQAAPVISLGGSDVNPVLMHGPDGLDRFFAQGVAIPPTVTRITVTNSADAIPTSDSAPLVDAISVSLATYDAFRQTLTVEATSSDKLGPTLTVEEMPTPFVTTCATVAALCPDKVRISQSLIPIPPRVVTVVSSSGGRAQVDVMMTNDNATFTPGAPFAADDVATVTAGGAAITIPVTANDKGTINPGSLQLVSAPAGTSVVPATNQISYTPPVQGGSATITYMVSNAVGRSNVATVNVTILGNPNPVPTVVNDTATLVARTSTKINVLANDSFNGATGWLALNPVAIVTQPSVGAATVDSAGLVTYTSPANAVASAQSFTYRAFSANGTSAVGTVNVTVTAPETLASVAAKCVRPAQWDLRGTSTVSGGTVDLFTLPPGTVGSLAIARNVPVLAGAWQFKGINTAAPCSPSYSIRGSNGGVLNNQAVQVK